MRCRLEFIFLPMDVQSFRHQLLKKFSYTEFLWYLVEISQAYFVGLFLGSAILFHWSMHLSLCQYHTVLVIVTIILKVGRVIPPVYSFHQDCVSYCRTYAFPYNFTIGFFNNYKKPSLRFWWVFYQTYRSI